MSTVLAFRGAVAAGAGAARGLEGGWRLRCTQKKINDQLIDAYYQRVVYLGKPDPRFLTALYQGCELLTGVSSQDLLEQNLLKAIVYNKVISASYLSLELRKTIIAAASLNAAVNLHPSKQEFRQMVRDLPAASRRYLRALPYEAAVMALVIYGALLPSNTATAKANSMDDSFAPVSWAQTEEKREAAADLPDLGPALLQSQEQSEIEAIPLGNKAAQTSAPAEDALSEQLASNLVQTEEASAVPMEAGQITTEADAPDSDFAVAEPATPTTGTSAGTKAPAVSAQTETSSAAAAVTESAQAATEETGEYYDIALSHELQDYTRQLCEEYNFPADYAFAMMFKESGFRPEAVSSTNDYGIMQINKCNHAWLKEKFGITNFLDAKQNIRCGVYMISQAYHKYGDIHKALMAYNMGDKGASNQWNQGVYTSYYSRTIVGYRETLVSTGRLP